ncbi:MAG: S-layer homology domain-containing protein, partial [Oscillospiraceae bacterium]|nr:S-layer homology domain-containing protein [Oscillospiraceae bacterium]
DVSSSAYYYDAVLWAVENGVTAGTSASTFSPDAACTRAQIVTFLWRAAGSPKTTGENPFTDVSSSNYAYDAILWAVENGVTAGTSASAFSPSAACTRGQIVTFLWRAQGK